MPASANPLLRSGRRIVSVWLSWAGVAELDRMATDEGVDRSTLIRTLLAEAIQARRRRTADPQPHGPISTS